MRELSVFACALLSGLKRDGLSWGNKIKKVYVYVTPFKHSRLAEHNTQWIILAFQTLPLVDPHL